MWKDYLLFSRKAQKGLFVLAVIIVLLIAMRAVLPFIHPSDTATVVENLDTLFMNPAINREKITKEKKHQAVADIPAFDPNHVTVEFLVRIGIRRRVAQNWYNYISKGGYFSTPEEVLKIYGIDTATVRRLTPLMRIMEQSKNRVAQTASSVSKPKAKPYMIDLNRIDSARLTQLGWSALMTDSIKLWQKSGWVSQRYNSLHMQQWNMDSLMAVKALMTPRYKKKTNSSFTIEINSADTSEWMLLKGIGPVISRHIVQYRQALGGYVSIEQLLEVEHVSPILFNDIKQHLTVNRQLVKPVNINTASVRQLRSHPCFNFYQAQAIVERRKKQKFTSVDEVWELEPFNSINREIAGYYLTVGNTDISK